MTGKWHILLLALGTVTTGCLNSIFTKYQDNQCVRNCSDPDPANHKNFEQPVLQSLQMFLGELLCYFIYNILYSRKDRKDTDYEPFNEQGRPVTKDNTRRTSILLSIPAACDLCGTTLMNLGLLYTPVSIYQMTRGSVIIFVAVFSVLFLKKVISRLEWGSLVIVVLGVAVVGLSGTKSPEASSAVRGDVPESLVILGMLFILLAQVFTATQFVVEEHILASNSIIPLKMVGLEGFFGSLISFTAMIILHIFVGATEKGKYGPFDMVNAFREMFSSPQVLLSSILIMCSISSFNFFGISITHKLSATSRSTIDTCRTLLVWLISMVLGWESFKFLQFTGFVFLVFGTLIFNGAIQPYRWEWVPDWFKVDSQYPRIIDTLQDEPVERI